MWLLVIEMTYFATGKVRIEVTHCKNVISQVDCPFHWWEAMSASKSLKSFSSTVVFHFLVDCNAFLFLCSSWGGQLLCRGWARVNTPFWSCLWNHLISCLREKTMLWKWKTSLWKKLSFLQDTTEAVFHSRVYYFSLRYIDMRYQFNAAIGLRGITSLPKLQIILSGS